MSVRPRLTYRREAAIPAEREEEENREWTQMNANEEELTTNSRKSRNELGENPMDSTSSPRTD